MVDGSETEMKRALSIRQPYAELILRGEKTVEYRTRPTSIVGERFYIYAAGKWPRAKAKTVTGAWSTDLAMPGEAAALPWLMEMARGLRLFPGDLPTGVLVGSAEIAEVVRRDDGMYEWRLAAVERLDEAVRPKGHPQPTWWYPFGRAA